MRSFAPGLLALFGLLPIASAQAETKLDYNRDIQPILAKNCFACHGPDDGHRSAGLRLDQRDAALATRKKGAAIVSGKPDASRIIARILDHDDPMPPEESGPPLSPDQVAKLKQWISEGAPYAQHWAFVSPTRPTPPPTKSTNWARNPIDAFILAKLESRGIAPSPMADRETLLRRVSLDLRGLPPTIAEIEAFRNDSRPDAYERMVDRFLADPAFGERWARMWLDLARYADSAGYGSDPLRLNIWPYRDWVIDAFNRNLPYDQFTIEQLAGDLLPNATPEQKMATAFHRNTMTNTEGGTDDEEFRVAAIKDRTDTTAQVWLGLTLGCAKCHNHKYDPLSQEEYYRFYAFFNQTADNDRGDESPLMPILPPSQRELTKQLQAKRDALQQKLLADTPEALTAQRAWEARLALTAAKLQTLAAKAISGNQRMVTLPVGEYPGIVLNTTAGEVASIRRGESKQPLRGSIVRIELPGKAKFLSLAEVELFVGGKNIAATGKAKQSSTDYNGPAHLAIDGNTNGQYEAAKSTSHTAQSENPWWEVELPNPQAIERIRIWNRTDGAGDRLANFRVSLLDSNRQLVWTQTVAPSPNPSVELAIDGPASVGIASQSIVHVGRAILFDSPLKVTEPINLVISFSKPLMPPAAADVMLMNEIGLHARKGMPEAVLQAIDLPMEKRTAAQNDSIRSHYRQIAPEFQALRSEIARIDAEMPKPISMPVMQELPTKQHRPTKLLNKGDFLNPGKPVTPGTPALFPPLPASATHDRLAMARWIASPENPLTARVAVNRLWAQLFARGIVETEEDFGTQGELPSHPELLDWLATEYVRLGWDTKAMLKMIVTSATYQQSSKVTPEQLASDPTNRWLRRAPRFRLEAEMVRDQALQHAGLLSRKLGGPSVYPPQPEGLWQAAFNGQRTYTTSTGEDRYRRGIYTIWRRSVPYPSMATFDAPSREICSVKRSRTNTPLQAFVTLNDPVFVEASQGLARRILREGGDTTEARIAFSLRLVQGRDAKPEQVAPLLKLYHQQKARLAANPAEAMKLATDPLGPLPSGVDAIEAATWTVIANVLLNLDSVLTRG
ncbi:DUF1553 domain-containing protein [Tuwongella immobilis]|uniref:Cytochrome c domain-containing protein n=1 Tax=Tuwongella immobilis TaxID=692036 RepID=A0A6C2YMT5_9BACT|nr:DUF1553 domain-containing protein [Tuwongella immobilis]VIP02908.1 secreted protein containing duf1549 : Uncharacterized protein OS=Pirellula staleyi (strain ATCC 27377 / DSM 6068 / ICPB 4128) GN=Psta_2234 PE=4 SV=1: PSCyt1: PSCyt2: F5_F8_type_C: PSD1 [Tuwongella immobilis]VTS02812.1 secreted protein containing duf1549 : Uncharacterized protein OS=Pirellula staleyi (strain ATCC 27377 / DSM 6068 / ICPB 4128) GN=Psta_2234 PE=4 SV=1: PSCyt1: PSCyt2: F5_F8_type_C: PSD1 [Tuwongella immobilis]